VRVKESVKAAKERFMK